MQDGARKLPHGERAPQSTLKSLIESLPAANQPELWDGDSLAEFEIDGKRYVVAGSDYRRQRDRQRREARIAKGRSGLEKFNRVHRRNVDAQKLSAHVGRMLDRARALKSFDYHIESDETATWRERTESVEAERRLDGWYLLTTTLAAQDAPKETVFGHYRNLLEVEDAFRETKSYIEMRPIYHQKDDRVGNHLLA